ncbi:hypothetical protein N7457_005457 [Penicillium paradoxum]|uniref:uncharacterized protein n=1 Tax=Penicillium paradoxum TaxID=176176 RepID=UPI002548D867|nr:uncharacterized protein N7457_005457 [Penicillium paradoxum]KAJ5780297.1 hypothetical protein N7457_005457 [Penicillium paradoxum]
MRPTQFLALAMAVATSEAISQGFNYGALKGDGSVKSQADFETEFATAKNLVGTDHAFTSARLYTMIQGGTANGPIEAIPAAIKEKTTLLLGLWASGGGMSNEIAALKSAIETYGDAFTDLVVGISVGSEDLYRNSEIGTKVNAGVGIEPSELVDYINQVRSAISGTSLSGAPIGHVDTWNTWTNSSNSAVVDAVDWLGFDGYPYFENTEPNSIDDAKALFDKGVAKTQAIAGGKEIWITETGWPVTGKTENLAVANTANARQYWTEVACPLLGNTNTWWYILEDPASTPSFGVTGSADSTTPLYDLSCKASNSSSSAVSSSTSTSTLGQKTGFASSVSATSTGTAASGASTGTAASGTSTGTAASGTGHSVVGPASTHPIGTRPSTKPKSKSASASAVATKTGSGSSSLPTGSKGSGSSSDSGSGSGSGSSSSTPGSVTSSVPFNSATRVAGSAAGALIAALALALTF